MPRRPPPKRIFNDAPRAAPYIAVDPDQRICLAAQENVARKLTQAQPAISPSTVRAVKNYLKPLTSTYARTIGPLKGDVPERTQTLIETLCDRMT